MPAVPSQSDITAILPMPPPSGVGVGVAVRVAVAVAVGVGVSVFVGVAEGVGVRVGAGVSVGVAVRVGSGAAGAQPASNTNAIRETRAMLRRCTVFTCKAFPSSMRGRDSDAHHRTQTPIGQGKRFLYG